MPSALPSALRVRFEDYVREGLSGRAAAARLKLSAATGVRWRRRLLESGSTEPDVQGRPPGHGKLAAHQAFLEELVERMATSRCRNLLEHWKLPPVLLHIRPRSDGSSTSSGTHIKKVVGRDRTPPRSRKASSAGLAQIPDTCNAGSDRLVFIDETSVKTNLTRQRGRSLRGERLEMNAPFGAWGTPDFYRRPDP